MQGDDALGPAMAASSRTGTGAAPVAWARPLWRPFAAVGAFAGRVIAPFATLLLVLPIWALGLLPWLRPAAQWLRAQRWFQRGLFAISRFAHGQSGVLWGAGIVVLLLLWFGLGGWVVWHDHSFAGFREGPVWAAVSEALFRVLRLAAFPLAIAPGDPWFVHLTRWPPIALPLWLAAPPLLRWVLRQAELGAVRNFCSGHYILVGYGHVGQALARDLFKDAGRDFAVVILDVASAQVRLDVARGHGAIVFANDGQDIDARALAAHRAAGILVAAGPSARNIDIAGRLARDVARLRRAEPRAVPRKAARIVPHIRERRMMDWVDSEAGKRWRCGDADDRPEAEAVEIRPEIAPFSTEEEASRRLLAKRPVAEYARLRQLRRCHFVVLGHDELAEWLVPQLFQAGIRGDLAPPRVTWVRDARTEGDGCGPYRKAFRELLQSRVTTSGELDRHGGRIELTLQEFDFSALDETLFDKVSRLPDVTKALATRWDRGQAEPEATAVALADLVDPVTSVFVCTGCDEDNLQIALRLHDLMHRHRRWLAPTFVRLFRDSGLQDVLRRCDSESRLHEIIDDFGQDQGVCTRGVIFDSPGDRAACMSHAMYQMSEAIRELSRSLPDSTSDLLAAVDAACDSWSGSDTGRDLAGLCRRLKALASAPQTAVADWLGEPPSKAAGDDLQAIQTRLSSIGALLSRTGRGASPAPGAAAQSWARLEYVFTASNYDQVDHVAARLRGAGYVPQLLASTATGGFPDVRIRPWPFADVWTAWREEFGSTLASGSVESGVSAPVVRASGFGIEDQARTEHTRWMVERITSGWRQGRVRDNLRRQHDILLPYDQLIGREADQLKNVQIVANIQALLKAATPEVAWWPELRVGFWSNPWAPAAGPEPTDEEIVECLQNACYAARASFAIGEEERGRQPLALSLTVCGRTVLDGRVLKVLAAWASASLLGPFRVIVPRIRPFPESAQSPGKSVAVDGNHEGAFQERLKALMALGLVAQIHEIDLVPEGLSARMFAKDLALAPLAEPGDSGRGAATRPGTTAEDQWLADLHRDMQIRLLRFAVGSSALAEAGCGHDKLRWCWPEAGGENRDYGLPPQSIMSAALRCCPGRAAWQRRHPSV